MNNLSSLISPKSNKDDESLDLTLRPKNWESYVGQDNVKKNIQVIIEAAKKTGAVVSVEEHQVNGGLGSAVAEVLSKNYPVPQEYIGVQDRFGESGEPFELIEKLGMGVSSIKDAVKKAKRRFPKIIPLTLPVPGPEEFVHIL